MNSLAILSTPITKQQILQTFEKYGLMPNSTISKEQMIEIMSNQYTHKTGGYINQQLTDQIWSQSQITNKGQISVNTITQVVLKAQTILGERIQNLRGNHGPLNELSNSISDKQKEIRENQQFNSQDTTKMNSLNKQLMDMEAEQRQNKHDLQTFTSDYETINQIFKENQNGNQFLQSQSVESQYTPTNRLPPSNKSNNQPIIKHLVLPSTPTTQQTTNRMDQKNSSNKLVMLFSLTCILLICQIFIMSFLRVSMFTLTAYLHSFYTLLIGLRNKHSIAYLIVHTLISFAADIGFVVLLFLNKIVQPLQMSTSYDTYLLLFFAILVITIVLRIIFVVILYSFRHAYEQKNENHFTIMGHEFFLNPIKDNFMNQPQDLQQQTINQNEEIGYQGENHYPEQQQVPRTYNDEDI